MCPLMPETASPPAFGPNWKSVDEINADAGDWNLVTNRADVMAEFPGYNAIIMCISRFYLIVLEGGAA